MSLYRRDDVWHYDFTVKGVRYRRTTGLRNKAAAAKVEELDKQRARLGELDRETLTLEQAANKWFAARAADKKSAKTTALRLEILLRHIHPAPPINTIDSPHVAEALEARRLEPTRQTAAWDTPKAPANATVNRDMIDSTLRPILRYARRVLKQPVNEIDWAELRLEEPKDRVRTFTPDEMETWGLELPTWHVPVRDFLGRYGLRLTEAFFPLSSINTNTWQITVRGSRRKNGRPHIIPLMEDDAKDIAARMGRAKAAGLDTVWFKEGRNGKLTAITPRGYQSAAKAALARANITDARPAHDLRHHAGTNAMRACGNLKVVQALLGHENIQSTARYAHADQSDVLKALEQVRDAQKKTG